MNTHAELCRGCTRSHGHCKAKYAWNKDWKRHTWQCEAKSTSRLFALLRTIHTWWVNR